MLKSNGLADCTYFRSWFCVQLMQGRHQTQFVCFFPAWDLRFGCWFCLLRACAMHSSGHWGHRGAFHTVRCWLVICMYVYCSARTGDLTNDTLVVLAVIVPSVYCTRWLLYVQFADRKSVSSEIVVQRLSDVMIRCGIVTERLKIKMHTCQC